MAVLERTREVGTLREMGLKRAGVVRLFVLENAMLGLLGFLPVMELPEQAAFLRKNYALLQVVHRNILDVLDLTVRWTAGLGDRSNRAAAIVEYDMTDRAGALAIGPVNTGGRGSEFGSVTEYSLMLGITFALH